jgi:hypothetical protein
MTPRNQGRNQYGQKAHTLAMAREAAAKPQTCQGCHALALWPRPKCTGETSPHYRMPRDTYNARCEAYAFRVDGAPDPVTDFVADAKRRRRAVG